MRKQKKNFFSRSSVRIVALAVFFCTVYLLKLPAISTSKAGDKLTCSRQEHTHISECYATAADLSGHICDPIKEAEILLEKLGIAGISPVAGVFGQSEKSESIDISAAANETDVSAEERSDVSDDAGEADKVIDNGDIVAGETGEAGSKVDGTDSAESEAADDIDYSNPVYSVVPDDDPAPAIQSDVDKVYILHTHNEYCYGDGEDNDDSDGDEPSFVGSDSSLSDSSSGNLLCQLEEVCAHVHDSECYEYLSSEDGSEEKRLCCKDIELEAHMHEEDCLDESGYLLCASPLVLEHEHTLSCFDEIEEQVCLLEEYSHTDSCYESISKEVPGIGTVLNPDGTVRKDYGDADAGCEPAGSGFDASSDADAGLGVDSDSSSDSGSDSSASASSGTGSDAGSDSTVTASVGAASAVVIDKNVYESVVMQDLGPFVTSVKASVNGDVLDNGSDLSNIVASYSKVDFRIEYKLPPNQLAGNAVNFRYQLPDNFVISSGGIHGGVYKASGEKVGIFSVVTDDKGNNYAYITFTDEKFINGNISTDNTAGSEISGYLNFSLQGSDLESDDTGDTVLNFGTGAGDVTIQIHVPGKEIVSKEDLSVTKTASEPDENGVIKYTITISSRNGTAGPVKITDWINNAVLGGENGDGNFGFGDLSPITNIIRNENSNSYELTLPAMSPGDTYTFTYEVKADTNANTTVYVSNTVNVSSIRSDGALLKDSDSTTTVLQTSLIWKAANVRWDGSQLIDWTIQINEAGIDIGGYTLSDPMFAEALGGLVKISPDPNSSDPGSYSYIKLDENNSYTFPEGSTGTYTVTFTTRWGDVSLGDHGIVNTAELSKGDLSYTGSATAWVSPYDKDALIKSAVGNTGSADEKQPADYIYADEDGNAVHAKVINLTWSVKMDAISGTLQPDWYYIDQLDNPDTCEYQWFTWEQIKGVKNSLDKALEKAGLKLSYDFILCPIGAPNVDVNYNTACSSSGNLEYYRAKRYKGFKLVFHDELPKGKSFEFEYSSMARIDSLTEKYSFINTGTLKDATGSITDTASQPYVPTLSDFVISKVDQRNPNGGDQTEVNYQAVYDSTLDAYVLKWKLNILIPASYDGESITITDTLPEGLTLHKLQMSFSFLDEPFFWREVSLKDGEHDIAGKTVSLHIDNDKNHIEFTIPKESFCSTTTPGLDTKIQIEVDAIIDEKMEWDMSESGDLYQVSFMNTLSVIDSDNNQVGSVTQTQTVNRQIPNLLVKDSHIDGNSSIEYTLTINPDRDDLLEGGELLTLIDTLSYSYNPSQGAVNVSLVPNLVKLYSEDRAGRQTELDLNVYPYSYHESRTTDTAGMVQGRNILTFTVPDETKLILKYKYHVTGDTAMNLTVKNSASLSGVSDNSSSDSTSSSVYVHQGNAGANLNSIGFLKVDANNASLHLPGVKFRLQVYDPNDGVWNDVDGAKEMFVTNDSGEFFVSIDILKENQAYRLKEMQSATGYLLGEDFCFYLSGSDIMPVFPDGISGRPVTAGQTIYITNEKQTMDLTVMKIWKDESGKDVTSKKTTGAVTYDLYRKIGPASREAAALKIDYECWNEWHIQKTETLPNDGFPDLVEGSLVTIQLKAENLPSGCLDLVQVLTADGCSVVSQDKKYSQNNDSQWNPTYSVTWEIVIRVAAGANHLVIDLSNAGDYMNGCYEVIDVIPPASHADIYSNLEGEHVGTFTIQGSEDTDWTSTHSNLEKFPMDSNGNYLKEPDGKKMEYVYYVEEKSTNGYISVVDTSKQNLGLITITNTETGEDFFVLPQTGGFGRDFVQKFGIFLMMSVCAAAITRRKRKDILS